MSLPDNLKKLCDHYGVGWDDRIDEGDYEPLGPVSGDGLCHQINERQTDDPHLELSDRYSETNDFIKLADVTGTNTRRFDDSGAFDEIGAPGVRVVGGVISQEPTSKYRPYQVRGHVTRHGLYEKLYRQEPVLFEGINEGNNIFLAGDVEFAEPDVPRSQKSEAEEYTRWTNHWFRQIWRGPAYYQRHVGAAKIFGFYPFEIVWGVDTDGRVHPTKFAPREPSTVDRWIFSPRGDELEAAQFEISNPTTASDGRQRQDDDKNLSYILTAKGPSLTDRRIHVANIYNRANNLEGVSYVRPVIHWIKFKQVLHQIAAVTAQKYGVPMAVIKQQPIDDVLGTSGDQKDGDFIFRQVSGQQANEAPVYQLAPGWEIELMDPSGQMPQLEALLNYADQMIAKPVKSEAGLLGKGSVGSYALSETLDNAMVRAQPGFAADALESLDWLVRDIAKWHGVQLDAYPSATWSMDGFADDSRWIQDATELMGGRPMDEWPDEMRTKALQKLDLPPSTFDDYDPPAHPEPSGQMFSGADLNTTDCCDHDHDTIELADTLDENIDADTERDLLDRLERRIGRELRGVAQDHRRAFREEVRDGSIPLREADQVMRERFLPQYEDVAREGMERVSDSAKRRMLRDLGFTVARDAEMPRTEQMDEALDDVAFAVADEFYGRQEGMMQDSVANDAAASDETGVPILEASTAALVARGSVGVAFNSGRDDIAQITQAAAPDASRIMARRSSMLDDNVCPECKALDFEEGDNPAVHVVGSQAYYDDMPPRHCDGERRCRCVYIYEIPDEYEGTLQEIADGQGFTLPPADRL